MQVVFVAHGAPTLAIDREKGADLRRLAEGLDRPRAILVVSAHWEDRAPTTGTTETRPLLYDFSGFPPELSAIRYEAPGAPELAARVGELLEPGGARRPDRPWDHGVWVPLLHMFPAADVPVLQLSLERGAHPRALFEIGAKLAPLRDEGVLVVGSGGIVHNLARIDASPTPAVPHWASEFDAWCANALAEQDFDALLDYRARAPAASLAQPTPEHIAPLFVAAGAASAGEHAVGFPVRGFEYGSLSRRCVQFGR